MAETAVILRAVAALAALVGLLQRKLLWRYLTQICLTDPGVTKRKSFKLWPLWPNTKYLNGRWRDLTQIILPEGRCHLTLIIQMRCYRFLTGKCQPQAQIWRLLILR
ncbi:hypothetical protein [Pantoea brenneri]|uniref:hypothetical protein n=1 Tax=Pantoea brenneri TaxID=472694 RepID=UPI00289E5EEA|nr:hypothetical protein [Pantoea brenneri]